MKERKITIATSLKPSTISILEESAKKDDLTLCAYIREVLEEHAEHIIKGSQVASSDESTDSSDTSTTGVILKGALLDSVWDEE